MGIISEFKDFMQEYKVTGLAIALVIGLAATTLVTALVNDIIMPIITAFIPGGEWQKATFSLGPIVIKWGDFLGALIYFAIVAFSVFLIAKYILREEKVTKK